MGHRYNHKDPLDFPGYLDKVAQMQEKLGCMRLSSQEKQSSRIAVSDRDHGCEFHHGQYGNGRGEKITRLFERAIEKQLPVVLYRFRWCADARRNFVTDANGKISAAVKRHSKAGLFYLTVLTDPTTGGVTASFAMEGDIILAEPQALIGFAGRRVIEQTIRQNYLKTFKRQSSC